MPLRAWVKERPNVTSARGGTRVRKDLRHRLQVAFVAGVVEPHTSLSVALLPVALMEAVVVGSNSLLVALMEEEAAELIIANCRNVKSQQLQHSITSWSIG